LRSKKTKRRKDMKKPISKIQTRSYCWLPLIVMCAVLPARADLISFTGDSFSGSGNLTLSGFDPSLGTLTGVSVFVDFDNDTSFVSDALSVSGTVDGVASFTGQVHLPDSTTLDLTASAPLVTFLAALGEADVDPDDPVQQTFTDPSALSAYTASTVQFTYETTPQFTGTVPLEALSTNEPNMELRVTYDYTPAVSAVPEPTAVLLLGTMAT
jgi:hypothetical protein